MKTKISLIEEKYNNPAYLQSQQYRHPGNLSARIEIHQRFSTGAQEWHDFVFQHLNPKRGMRGLALGCGNATQWRVNRSRFPEDCKVVLSDFSIGMLEEPQRELLNDTHFELCVIDAMDVAFGDCQFDFVTANHMLYHVPEIECALAEIRRVLKEDGFLMAATNGKAHMVELDRLLELFHPEYQGAHAMSGVFNLQNGQAYLEPFFEEIKLIPYLSDLWITDARLLADYAWSMPKVQVIFQADQKDSLISFFQERINTDGGILIRKETGLFIARKPRK